MHHTTDAALHLGRAWWAAIVFLVAASIVTIDVPYDNSPPIRADGLGYHTWTRALLDGNLSFCPYELPGNYDAISPRVPETGRCANKYAPGLALVRLPVMVWFTAANGGELRSPAEDVVSQWFAVAAGTAAVAASVVAARRLGATQLAANGAAAATAVGTGVFHYATYDGSFTHVYLALYLGVVVAAGATYVNRPPTRRAGPAALIGVAVFWLLLTRTTTALVIATVATTWLVRELRQGSSLGEVWRVHRRLVSYATFAALAAVVPQLVHHALIYGKPRLSAYSEESFVWSQWKQPDVLLLFERGAVIWYPIIAVALIVAVGGRWRYLAAMLGISVVALTALYGAWHQWDLGGGFGHRGFVELMPLAAVALGCGCTRLSLPGRAIGWSAAVLAAFTTAGLMRAYWVGGISFYGADAGAWLTYGLGSDNLLLALWRWIGP